MAQKSKVKTDEGTNYLRYILIIMIVAIAAYFIYNYYQYKNKTEFKVKTNEDLLKDKPEPQFVKQGELEFLKKDNKSAISKIDIEIADDDAKSQQGLMYRKSMDENRGMLFIFKKPAAHSFWMKNTLISLDIIFLDTNKRIIKIHKHTTPLSEKDLPSGGPTLYVVEVIAGYTDKYGIAEGDFVNFTKQ